MPSLHYENGYALLIGIKYAHWDGIGLLNGTLNDIRDLKNHFLHPEKAAYLPENVQTLREEQATAANILKALDDLAEKVKNDPEASVLVYYSGHGETDGTHHFLVPYDFDLERWQRDKTFDENSIVSSKLFTQKLDAITAEKCIVILDCCHAESMPTDKGMQGRAQQVLSELKTGIANRQSKIAEALQTGKGKVILTSCEAHEKSLDLGTNGLFTQVLLDCLNGTKNLKKDGFVRLIDMMDYVPKTVKKRALAYTIDNNPHQQNPMFKRIENLNSEDFIVCAYNIAQAKGLDNLLNIVENTNDLDKFKTELYALLEEKQQNAIADITIKIAESPYDCDRVLLTTLKGANPMQLAMMPEGFVNSAKLLIHSLKKPK